MIARITGKLEQAGEGAALVSAEAGLWYEVLIPAFDAERLGQRVGQEVALHTIHYLEGNPSRGVQTPRLIGFLSESDREFFRIFTTVKGIGVRKALRSLVRPVSQVAGAITSKDAVFLGTLPEIGKRTAELIITELHGKVDEFAGPAAPLRQRAEMPEPGAEAVAVLVQLGERRADAMALVQRVLDVAPELDKAEVILQQAYKLKAAGA